jgi:hypothetical protein
MTKDDKQLRDTILAELRRRRGLLGKDEDPPRIRPRTDVADGSRELPADQRAACRV